MSSLDPAGPAQPPSSEAYKESANPVTSNPEESAAATHDRPTGPTETRGPSSNAQDDASRAVPTSLGRGVHGSGPTNPTEARETHHVGDKGRDRSPENENVDAEQMATLGEGEVADAVERKSGGQLAPGQEGVHLDDNASDLGRKKAEQASAREAVKDARKEGVDVDAGTSGRMPHAEVD